MTISNFHARGFSLIELMIAVTLGLLGLLAVTTIYIEFNKHRTVETSLMEAQNNGALALFLLERDLDRAGSGFMALQGCRRAYDDGGGVTARSFCQTYPTNLTPNPQSALPLVVTDGGTGSDRIRVQYGTPLGGLSVTTILDKQVNFSDPFKLKSAAGIVIGDIIVLNRGGNCAAYEASGVSESTKTVSHEPGTGSLNVTAAPTEGGYDTAMANDWIVNLGHYVSKDFFIDATTSQLVESSRPTYADNNPVVDDIVYMKADIGRDTDNDNLVNVWDKPLNVADYSTVIAIRVGIVARSQVVDRESPTPPSLVVLPAITGGTEQTYTVPDQKYRYKVYYTIIPLRNMLWS